MLRAIPSTGEQIPVIGCGTYRGFDVADAGPAKTALAGVVDAVLQTHNAVLDSSPMYGRAEQVLGSLLADTGRRAEAFLATKVWTRGKRAGIAQMEQSLALLQTERIDLMQVHNLVDYAVHLETLANWRRDGRVRYVGLTHYTRSAYAEMEAAIRATAVDFIQINYSLDDRAAEERLLPLASDRGIAVLVNMPFGGGGLLQRLLRRPLPEFAPTIGCSTWSQLLLKFVIGHPAVTSAIPGTGDPAHIADNIAAGQGDVAEARDRIRRWWDAA